MKIHFINGVERSDGQMVIWDGSLWCWCLGYYQRTGHVVLAGYKEPKRTKSRIVIVRQKNKLFTLRILGHEIAHWLVDKFFCKRTREKFDRWLDRKAKRHTT